MCSQSTVLKILKFSNSLPSECKKFCSPNTVKTQLLFFQVVWFRVMYILVLQHFWDVTLMQPTVRTKFADLSLRRSGFNPRLLHVRFVRAELDWDRIFSQYFDFLPSLFNKFSIAIFYSFITNTVHVVCNWLQREVQQFSLTLIATVLVSRPHIPSAQRPR
jgi:hypothetical protein